MDFYQTGGVLYFIMLYFFHAVRGSRLELAFHLFYHVSFCLNIHMLIIKSVTEPLFIVLTLDGCKPFMPSGHFYLTSLDRSISCIGDVWLLFIMTLFCRKF